MEGIIEMRAVAAAPAQEAKGPGLQLKNWHVFAIVALANLAVAAYFNQFVLTRDVYASLMSDKLDSTQVDQYFNFLRKLAFWGYLFAPAILWLRIAFVSLLTQFLLILFMVDAPFAKLFRGMSWAMLMLLYGSVVQAIWLGSLNPSDVTQGHLTTLPGSLSMFIMDFSEHTRPLYNLISYVNVFELAWCVFAVMAVRSATRLKLGGAIATVMAVWASVVALKWGLFLLFAGMGS